MGARRDPDAMVSRALTPLAAALRRHDRDRFQTALFAPGDRREALFALYAFNYEVARIREAVREPLLGRIRLQWWRDAIAEIYAGAPPRRHDVVEPLARAIRDRGLGRAHFDTLLEARELDLGEAQPATLAALETYAEGSSASLVLLALEALGAGKGAAAEAARPVGIAYALSGLLAAAPFHARMKRSYLPQDRVAAHGLDPARSLFELKASPSLAAVAEEIAQRARHHLDAARRHRNTVPRAALPALLPAVLAEHRLARLARIGYDIFDPRWQRPAGTQSWRLLWAALRRAY